jgi:hypothetical protein
VNSVSGDGYRNARQGDFKVKNWPGAGAAGKPQYHCIGGPKALVFTHFLPRTAVRGRFSASPPFPLVYLLPCQPCVEPVGVVENVGMVGIVDHKFKLLRARNVDGNGQRRSAAANDRAGVLFLAID